jgi:hypothetical protein
MMQSEYKHSEWTEQIIGAAHKAARFEVRLQIIPHQCQSVSNFPIPNKEAPRLAPICRIVC